MARRGMQALMRCACCRLEHCHGAGVTSWQECGSDCVLCMKAGYRRAHLWEVLALTDLYLTDLARGQGVPVGYGLMMDAG